MQPPAKKLLDQVRDAIRVKHYSYRTEEAYVQWIRRYILFHAQGNQFSSDRSYPPTFHPQIPDTGVPVYGSTRLRDRPTSKLIDPDQLGDKRLG
jgi:Phage integrase, N-terminal SAM-like domain